jgi:hypothetical protein
MPTGISIPSSGDMSKQRAQSRGFLRDGANPRCFTTRPPNPSYGARQTAQRGPCGSQRMTRTTRSYLCDRIASTNSAVPASCSTARV